MGTEIPKGPWLLNRPDYLVNLIHLTRESVEFLKETFELFGPIHPCRMYMMLGRTFLI